MTVKDKCVPHYKNCNHLNSVEPSGNYLLICGNPTQPASLVTTKTSKPTLIISVTQLAEKITLVVIAADLFGTSLWEHLGMRHEGFRIPQLILMLENTMRVNVKIIRSKIWDISLVVVFGYTFYGLYRHTLEPDECSLPQGYNVMQVNCRQQQESIGRLSFNGIVGVKGVNKPK